MGSTCTVRPVLVDVAVACEKPGTSSRGLWTVSESADGVDDDCVNSCLFGYPICNCTTCQEKLTCVM